MSDHTYEALAAIEITRWIRRYQATNPSSVELLEQCLDRAAHARRVFKHQLPTGMPEQGFICALAATYEDSLCLSGPDRPLRYEITHEGLLATLASNDVYYRGQIIDSSDLPRGLPTHLQQQLRPLRWPHSSMKYISWGSRNLWTPMQGRMLSTPVKDLNVPRAVKDTLHSAGLQTWADVTRCTYQDLIGLDIAREKIGILECELAKYGLLLDTNFSGSEASARKSSTSYSPRSLSTPLKMLGVQRNVVRSLEREGITTLLGLSAYPRERIRSIRGIGNHTIARLEGLLWDAGLSFDSRSSSA